MLTFSLSACSIFNVEYVPYMPDGQSATTDYSISENEVTINVGESITLKGLIDGDQPPFDLCWKTSDDYVATVNSKGEVKGVGGGMCQISVFFTKEKSAHCYVNVVGERKLPKLGALGKFFIKNGETYPVSYQDHFLYNKYVISGETIINGYKHTYEYLFIDEHETETPFKIQMSKYDENNIRYTHEFRFQELKFFEGFGLFYVYETVGDHSINAYGMLDKSYYAQDGDHVSLANGKTIPEGDGSKDKAATPEQVLETFYLINDCIDYLYKIMETKGTKVKLF